MAPMTDEPQPIGAEERAAWSALLDAATPGPWIHTEDTDTTDHIRNEYGDNIIWLAGLAPYQKIHIHGPDATLIAAAPEAMRRLLAENEALRTAVSALAGEVHMLSVEVRETEKLRTIAECASALLRNLYEFENLAIASEDSDRLHDALSKAGHKYT